MKFVKHGVANVFLSLDNDVATKRIIEEIESGSYEQREMTYAGRLAKATDRILELGAGIGFVSTVICSKITPSHYTAVEADNRLIPHIHRTHERNNTAGVNVVHGAFVSKPNLIDQGFVEFGVSKAFWGSGIDKAGTQNVQTVRVKTYDISSFIKENKINLLISDIEGGELDVLRSMFFGPLRRIIMEVHPKMFGADGVRELFQIMDRNGFVYNAHNSCGPVVTFDKIAEPAHGKKKTKKKWFPW